MKSLSYKEYLKKVHGEQHSLNDFGIEQQKYNTRSSLKLRRDEYIDENDKVRRR
jgi:hypothetical protein